MRLKLYRADRMADALSRIRSELGADALILSTRRLGTGVEVTAALQEPQEDPQPLEPSPPNELARDHTGWNHPVCESPAQTKLDRHGIPPRLAARLSHGPLARSLAAALTFAPLPTDQTLMLVGPPGAGKTLTTARLATRFVLAGATPTVLSADGLRAGAAEQLAAYTRLLSLSLIVAPDPVTVAKALARPRPPGPVLIDCPGSDPFNEDDMQQMQAIAATAQAAITLVLPAGLCPQEAADLARAYRTAGARHLIATRLDLARRLGSVLAAADAGGLSLTEAGIGPGAADGLVPLTPEFLAARLLPEGVPA